MQNLYYLSNPHLAHSRTPKDLVHACLVPNAKIPRVSIEVQMVILTKIFIFTGIRVSVKNKTVPKE